MNSVWCYRRINGTWWAPYSATRDTEYTGFTELPPLLQQKLAVLQVAPVRLVIDGVGCNYGEVIACHGAFVVYVPEGGEAL